MGYPDLANHIPDDDLSRGFPSLSNLSACSEVMTAVSVHTMKQITLLLLASLCTLFTACDQPKNPAPVSEQATKPAANPESAADPAAVAEVTDVRIIIHTDKGDVGATIFATKVPITAANFLNLANRGYYNGVKFHRVIPNFMVQGGDPTETGRGGPGYKFEDEFVAELKHSKAGTFSMANAGPGTNGSQFFITHKATPHLDRRHTVFGEVTKGMENVNAITGKLSGPGWKTDGVGSKITSIEILDNCDELYKAQSQRIADWNTVLDVSHPRKSK
ncbi:MAG: peptidyl-prolyl cis-trans isomerase B (cyclophilin B) [Crocinitomicaceae bacterium]